MLGEAMTKEALFKFRVVFPIQLPLRQMLDERIQDFFEHIGHVPEAVFIGPHEVIRDLFGPEYSTYTWWPSTQLPICVEQSLPAGHIAIGDFAAPLPIATVVSKTGKVGA
jgi:hypothetical protein